MAMTKKEAAEMEVLREELAEARALRWSGLILPRTLPPPQNGYLNGWQFSSHDRGSVSPIWTEKTAHGHGHRADDGNWVERQKHHPSQNGIRVFEARLYALIALRLAKEQECAVVLARIDQQIVDEREKPTT